MKLYVFEYVSKVSDNYHEGGGLLVAASDRRVARNMIFSEPNVEVTDEEWEKVRVYQLAASEAPHITIFPDAGCC